MLLKTKGFGNGLWNVSKSFWRNKSGSKIVNKIKNLTEDEKLWRYKIITKPEKWFTIKDSQCSTVGSQ